MSKSATTANLDDMAAKWFGYGRWSAPYWFLGPEPGMGVDEGDNLIQRYHAWAKLGRSDLLDCAAHHAGFGFAKWHGNQPPTQPTWRQLIRLLLAYQGESTDIASVREYQRSKWGAESGEVCVIELSGLAAHKMTTPRDRKRYREERIQSLGDRIDRLQPSFVVCYGSRNHDDWQALAGGPFDRFGRRSRQRTIITTAKHPVGGVTTDYWIQLGKGLRKATGKAHP